MLGRTFVWEQGENGCDSCFNCKHLCELKSYPWYYRERQVVQTQGIFNWTAAVSVKMLKTCKRTSLPALPQPDLLKLILLKLESSWGIFWGLLSSYSNKTWVYWKAMGRQNQSRVPFFGSKNIMTGTHNDHRVLQNVWMYRALTDSCLYKPNSSKFLSKRMFSFFFPSWQSSKSTACYFYATCHSEAPWYSPSILSMSN